MTNADRIRAMSNEELAVLFAEHAYRHLEWMQDIGCVMQWLNAECKEEQHG